MFGADTYRDIAVIVNHWRKKVPTKLVSSGFIAAKDSIALYAGILTSGYDLNSIEAARDSGELSQEKQDSLNILVERFTTSVHAFVDLLEEMGI